MDAVDTIGVGQATPAGQYDLAIEVGIPGEKGHHRPGVVELDAEEATRLSSITYPAKHGTPDTSEGRDLSRVSISWEPIITPHKRGPGRPPKPRDEPRDDGLLHDG